MTTNKEETLAGLSPYGQSHLLRFWDELEDGQRAHLVDEIISIDFALLDRLYRQEPVRGEIGRLAACADSPPSYRLGGPGNKVSPDRAQRRGSQALEAGQVAVILVAGGQGTRLGFDAPKGMYPIGPVSGSTLFQIHVEKVLAARRRYGPPIPLCVMTSPATHEATLEFFQRHQRFGLPKDDFYTFCQGTMPAVDEATGQVLLAEKHRIALSPDGHGGMLAAISSSGTLEALDARGVQYLFYFQVDNPMVDVCSPEFLGYHLLADSELSTQVVRKKSPADRVGNVVAVDDRLHVIEYSDLPDEVAERRNPDGSLAVWAGSIAVHGMNVSLLQTVARSADSLPFHIARKRVSYVDSGGRTVTPHEPNAVKFERFIFDLMPSANQAIVVEVDAAEHFGPLKNAPGQKEDTPETVRAQMVALHTRWLKEAGAEVSEGVPVEISPLFAMDAEELRQKLEPGTRVTEPTYYR